MLVQQVSLRSGNSFLTGWVDKMVKIGHKITLKEDETRWWVVEKIYNVMGRADIHDAHESRKWHENDFHGRLKGLQHIFK